MEGLQGAGAAGELQAFAGTPPTVYSTVQNNIQSPLEQHHLDSTELVLHTRQSPHAEPATRKALPASHHGPKSHWFGSHAR